MMQFIAPCDMLEKTERLKYCHPEYSDGEIDGLMRYFRFETYVEFLDFLRKYKSRQRDG